MDGGTESNKFRIDEDGRVVTMTSLDYETDPQTFDLKIVATDTKSSMSSSVNVGFGLILTFMKHFIFAIFYGG